MSEKERIRIVIVGAGIAGLSAADTLINKYGFTNVSLFEASDRVGGRIWPVNIEGIKLQLGAQFIHGKANPVYQLAKELGVLPPKKVVRLLHEASSRYYTDVGYKIPNKLADNFADFYERTDEELDQLGKEDLFACSQSVGELFEKHFEQFLLQKKPDQLDTIRYRALFAYLRKVVEAEHACSDWYTMSFRTWSLYEEWPKYEELTLNKDGYGLILETLKQRVKQERIFLKCCVNKVETKHGGLRLLVSDNWIKADHVIITCSLGYLKKYAIDIFSPPLPERKITAIRTLGFDTLDKVFLFFDKPFWPKHIDAINLVRTDKDIEETASDLSSIFFSFETDPWHEGVLLAWISGKDPSRMENASEKELSDAAVKALSKFLPKWTIPKPSRILRTRWANDEFSCGSYSYYSKTADLSGSTPEDLAQPIAVERNGREVPVLLFAGEATHSSMFQTTHGAMLSGIREANRLNMLYHDSGSLDAKGGAFRPTDSLFGRLRRRFLS